MQISSENGDGTVQITHGSARVIASAGVNWAAAVAGNWLSIQNSSNVPYDIAAVYEPGHAGNTTMDRWELTIVGVVNEATSAAIDYAIGVDFTAVLGMWDPQIGDTQTLQYLKRNFRIIDTAIGRGLPKNQSIAITSVNSDWGSNQSTGIHSIKASVAAGSGAYTGTLSLIRSGRIAGDRASIHVDMPASVNPTFKVFDDTTSGTKLFEWTGDGTATQIVVECVFDGAAWYLHDAHFLG